MSPISFERKTWIEQRIKVLDACIVEANRGTWYANKLGSTAEALGDVQLAQQNLRAERAQLFIEYQILSRMEVTE